MPFLTTTRFSEFGTYIEDKVVKSKLQITDLFPNKSQSNAVITPRFQGPYHFRPIDMVSEGNVLEVLPVLDGDRHIDGEVSGLAAYFLAVVEDTANNINITPNAALAIASDMIARVLNAQPLRLSDINASIVLNVGVGSDLDGTLGNSTGSVKEVLEILCGAKTFTLADDHSIGDVGNGNEFTPFANPAAQAAAFSDIEGYTSIPSTHSSFYISARKGQIKTAQLALKEINNIKQPVLVAYDDDGSIVK